MKPGDRVRITPDGAARSHITGAAGLIVTLGASIQIPEPAFQIADLGPFGGCYVLADGVEPVRNAKRTRLLCEAIAAFERGRRQGS